MLARGVAWFLAATTLLDLVTGALVRRDALLSWWLNVPTSLQLALTVVTTALFGAYALAPQMARWRRWATLALVGLLLAMALRDTAVVLLLARAGFDTGPVPLSALVVVALACVGIGVARAATAPSRSSWRRKAITWVGTGACAAAAAFLFALAQMWCFGGSDYRRPADAVVVFGAKAYADGRPSLALEDRVRTGAQLVIDGYAPRLLLSGGPAAADVHEVEVMRAIAIAEGVPPEKIVVDRQGLSTRATVGNTASALGCTRCRVLAVSHDYHLPRIKLSYQQAGIDAYTVPADETRPLLALPWYMARETLALWAYAFRLA